MKKSLKTRMGLGVFILVCFMPGLGVAMLWPVFSPPTKRFLLNNDFIDTAHCPPGQGKLMDGIRINIHNSVCHTYCPVAWTWIGKSDGACHDLAKGFAFQKVEITHYPDNNDGDDGNTLYSEVTAFYGEKGSDQSAFTFVFTAPKEHWYCMEMNPELHLLTCANDM